jgi:hypothetical protein
MLLGRVLGCSVELVACETMMLSLASDEEGAEAILELIYPIWKCRGCQSDMNESSGRAI